MKIGFIGCGNMASAMIGGILQAQIVSPSDILASDAYPPSLEKARQTHGIETTERNEQIAQEADVIVLAVKPHQYPAVIQEIAPQIKKSAIIISIAPGQSLEKMRGYFGKEVKIVRTMPNTPAMVGEGMTAACKNEHVTQEEMQTVLRILSGFGKAQAVDEKLMNAVVVASGSSPAYVFMMIEAMADAAVIEGMPRAQAYEFVTQAIYGSAKMALESHKHPGELKDMVCSPAGTTIEAVRSLEKSGFRSSLIEAMIACADKCRQMES